MSDAYAQDLYTKLATVTALANSAGFALGGKQSDPALTKIPLPAAWVMLGSDNPIEKETDGQVAKQQILQIEYMVSIYMPYTSQADLIATQFPLLWAVRLAIHGTDAPNRNRWKYQGRSRPLLINPDRLCYMQRYSIRVGM